MDKRIKINLLLLTILISFVFIACDSIPEGLEYRMNSFEQCVMIVGYTGNAKTLTIPAKIQDWPVVYVWSYAFYDNISLTTLNLPKSVLYIENDAFIGCKNLTTINVSSDNPVFSSTDGIVYDKAQRALIVYPTGRAGDFSVPENITKIWDFAFDGCINISAINIHGNVTEVGYAAFRKCSSLKEINVTPDNSVFSSIDGVLYNKTQRTLIAYPGGRGGAFTIPYNNKCIFRQSGI